MYVTVVAKFILQEFDVHRLQHPLPPLVEQVTAYIRNDNRNNNGMDMLILKIIITITINNDNNNDNNDDDNNDNNDNIHKTN